MIENINRVGRFTSSEIAALMTNGKAKGTIGQPGVTYIEEKNMERRLGRSLSSETSAKPILWGKLLEKRAFDQLGLEYQLVSDETIQHPEINYWAGSPDGFTQNKVADIKCPFTLKSFCQLVDPVYSGMTGMDAINKIRGMHKDGEKYYWQLVSNSILLKKQQAELIIYCPYQSELTEIRSSCEGDGKYYWLSFSEDCEIPYLPDSGYYKNINVITFDVPQEDKDAISARVIEAGKMLINI